MTKPNIFEGRRILVIEDDYWIMMDMIKELRERGAEIVGPFPTVQKAVEMLEEGPDPDGAILDINVQGLRSYAVADVLKEKKIPFLFATGYDKSEVPTVYEDVPVFQKPVTATQIASVLIGG